MTTAYSPELEELATWFEENFGGDPRVPLPISLSEIAECVREWRPTPKVRWYTTAIKPNNNSDVLLRLYNSGSYTTGWYDRDNDEWYLYHLDENGLPSVLLSKVINAQTIKAWALVPECDY